MKIHMLHLARVRNPVSRYSAVSSACENGPVLATQGCMRTISACSAVTLAIALHTTAGAQSPSPARPVEYVRMEPGKPSPVTRQNLVREVTTAPGSVLRVRLDQSVDTRRSKAGDQFTATVTAPVISKGIVVVPVGAHASGRIVDSSASGRFKGRAVLALRLDAVEVRGERYAVRTEAVSRATTGHKKRNLTLIGGGSGLGAALGAIAGGGAGAGAGAGTIAEGLTGRKQLRLPVETPLTFRLRIPLTVRI